jgi:hypothetical protein
MRISATSLIIVTITEEVHEDMKVDNAQGFMSIDDAQVCTQ